MLAVIWPRIRCRTKSSTAVLTVAVRCIFLLAPACVRHQALAERQRVSIDDRTVGFPLGMGSIAHLRRSANAVPVPTAQGYRPTQNAIPLILEFCESTVPPWAMGSVVASVRPSAYLLNGLHRLAWGPSSRFDPYQRRQLAKETGSPSASSRLRGEPSFPDLRWTWGPLLAFAPAAGCRPAHPRPLCAWQRPPPRPMVIGTKRQS